MSNDDLFGKMDALFEKRAPDVLVDKGLEAGDFPLMTDIVDAPAARPHPDSASAAQASDRRGQDRRAGDRRLSPRRETDPRQAISPRPTAADPHLEALLAAMEQRLADLFIRQQLRMEEAMRKTITPQAALFAPDLEGQLLAMEKRLADNFTRQQLRTEDILRRTVQAALDSDRPA
ncbi:MAG: hypothetical protein HZB71_11100 [Betaproteobacteria bacterium]|nr:hypothetical protein [Betaproteobacteria bacterium]